MLNIKSEVIRNISNIPGWTTPRKIVVIESDDWGSIRMTSKDAFRTLKLNGIDESHNHYNLFDALECNDDLLFLFETLTKFRDATNRQPVITGVNIVANPDFEKIKANDFEHYYWESFAETLKRYDDHDKVLSLYNMGIQDRLFIPVFHGREHLNVLRWMKALQQGHKTTHVAFNCGVTGVYAGINGELVDDYQAAFDVDLPTDIGCQKEVIETGLDLFQDIFQYKAEYFVPTNGPFNNELEQVLSARGVRFVNSAKVQNEPLGYGQYKRNVRFLGSRNQFGQYYITRNCFFEPSSLEYPKDTDWVGKCLNEIKCAFRWKKPAIISTHRVNYAGYLYPQNRENGLNKLSELLRLMLKCWPDIEFMTTVELGHLIENEKISR